MKRNSVTDLPKLEQKGNSVDFVSLALSHSQNTRLCPRNHNLRRNEIIEVNTRKLVIMIIIIIIIMLIQDTKLLHLFCYVCSEMGILRLKKMHHGHIYAWQIHKIRHVSGYHWVDW